MMASPKYYSRGRGTPPLSPAILDGCRRLVYLPGLTYGTPLYARRLLFTNALWRGSSVLSPEMAAM